MLAIAVATIMFAFIVSTQEKVLVNTKYAPSHLKSFVSSKKKSKTRGTASTLVDTPFCNLLEGALATGATKNRKMIHAFVSNSGHFQFLHNVLLSMV